VALAGAAFTPELYACAASVSGISDLPQYLAHIEARWGEESDTLAYWRSNIGRASDGNVVSRSPVRGAATVRAPILLLHGMDDSVVPVMQSQTMATALTKAGKPHQFVKLPGEDHWLSRAETRTRVLKELDTFLAKYLAAPN
jgi:dipeptidyl aminopeptidase/acylaminoacyl peptidase